MARVIQITDTHLSTDPAEELLGCRTQEGLHAVLRAIQDNDSPCDRLIVTGDLVHEEGPEAYYMMRELLTPWDNKLRVIPGNHDLRDGMRAVFGDRMNGCDHAVTFTDELCGWHLIGLDTLIDGSVEGDLSGPQWEWLESELESSSLPTALFMHHPPVFVGSEWVDQLGLVSFVKFANLVERFEQIKLVVCGHVHQEFQTQLFQAKVLTTPSTSVQFKPGSKEFATEDRPPGFLVMDLHEGGQFETTLVRVS
ncbi:MAG: metallophosphoesterase [Planctomycetota bacterium]|nr:metallophosphoesterase [Planctomycetota bacterium]